MTAISVELEGDTWEWHSAVVFPVIWSFLAAAAGCCCKPACSPLSWAAAPLVHLCCTSGRERGRGNSSALNSPTKWRKIKMFNFSFFTFWNFFHFTLNINMLMNDFLMKNEIKLNFSQFFECYKRFSHFITVFWVFYSVQIDFFTCWMFLKCLWTNFSLNSLN